MKQLFTDAHSDEVMAVDSRRSLAPRVYVDPHVLTHEISTLFSTCWIGVGRSDRWSQVGDFVALDIGPIAVAVIRNREGQLQAMSNVCTHRGTKLLEGKGQVRAVVCPFHGWTFNLQGDLTGAPGMGTPATSGFDRRCYGLRQFHLAERFGFVFINLAMDPVPVDTWLAGFEALHAPWSLKDLVSTRRREFEVDCNWKLFLDVFNEYYHLPTVHPKSIAGTFETPDAVDEVAGHFTSQFGATRQTASLLSADQTEVPLPLNPALTGREQHGTRYTWCFPNMTFAASTDCVWMYDVFPLAPNRTRVGMTICFPPATVALDSFEARVPKYYERFDVAIEEDITVLVRQQAGMASPFATTGPWSSLEPGVAAFAHWYRNVINLPDV